MRKSVQTAFVLASLVGLPAVSHAQCGGSNFATCASVSISKTFVTATVTEISMTITNLSGTGGTYAGTVFTSMGLYGLPSFSYVAGSLSVSGAGSWTLGTSGLSGSGITANVAGAKPTAPPTVNGLHAGESVTLTFRISGPSLASIDENDWAIHGQGGYNSCSTKLVSTDGTLNSGPYDPNCIDPNSGGGGASTVAPEPASVALVGTGLFGLAGGLARRRRKA